jgi:hypothetical protein
LAEETSEHFEQGEGGDDGDDDEDDDGIRTGAGFWSLKSLDRLKRGNREGRMGNGSGRLGRREGVI